MQCAQPFVSIQQMWHIHSQRSAKPSVLPTPRSPRRRSRRPTLRPHALLNSRPNALNRFPIAPSPALLLRAAPLLQPYGLHRPPPPLHRLGQCLALPPHIDAEGVAEQLGGVGPAVRLELPDLAGGEDGDDTRPVVGLEVLGAVNQNEAQRRARRHARHRPRRVQDVARRARARRRLEHPGLEERLDVRHPQQRGRRRRQQDDWLEPPLAGR